MRKIKAVIGAAVAVGGLAGGLAVGAGVLPASAKVVYPNVFLVDTHGVYTTPCAVTAGETLHGTGPVAGQTVTIVAVTPDGPVSRVTLSGPLELSPPQVSTVLDFIS